MKNRLVYPESIMMWPMELSANSSKEVNPDKPAKDNIFQAKWSEANFDSSEKKLDLSQFEKICITA